jgi:hypothetical protein
VPAGQPTRDLIPVVLVGGIDRASVLAGVDKVVRSVGSVGHTPATSATPEPPPLQPGRSGMHGKHFSVRGAPKRSDPGHVWLQTVEQGDHPAHGVQRRAQLGFGKVTEAVFPQTLPAHALAIHYGAPLVGK